MADANKPGVIERLFRDAEGLLNAPRDLWIIYAVKLIESIAYFAMLGILVLYLHDDLWFSDTKSGVIYGTWGTVVALLTFISGFVADAMGQRKALLIAALTLVVGRALLITSDITALPLFGLLISTWGVASMKPVMTAAVKRHAPGELRAFAYNIFYVVMNFGAFLAGLIVSGLRRAFLGRAFRFGDGTPLAGDAATSLVETLKAKLAATDVSRVIDLLPKAYAERASAGGDGSGALGTLGDLLGKDPSGAETMTYVVNSLGARATGGRAPDHWTQMDLDLVSTFVDAQIAGTALPNAPFALSGYELIYIVSALLSVASLMLLTLLRKDSDLAPTTADAAHATADTTPESAPLGQRILSVMRSVLKEPTFWAYLLFITVLVLVRAIFVHAHSTWPTYMLREFGKDVPQAAIWSINPLLIIFLTPVIGGITSRFSAWSVIMVGSFITAFSVLCMVVPGPFVAISETLVHVDGWQHAWAAPLAFVVILSIGEALWSPRLYEYVAFMAPEGREASYMGLTQLPMFAAKPLVGLMSGLLLTEYVPETGARQSDVLWLIIFATTLAGPVVALLFSGFIRGAERAKQAEADAAATQEAAQDAA